MKKCKKILAALAFILCLGMLCNSAMEVQAATKLKAPGNFKGTTERNEEYVTVLTITWDEVKGAKGYKVFYREVVPGEEYFDEWYLVEETTETTSQGSIIDGIFQMKVCAYNSEGEGVHTDVITVLGGEGIIDNPEVTLNEKKVVLKAGEQFELELANAPSDIKWKSKNTKVATVNKDGVVTAQGAGKCKVVAVCNGVKYKCKVKVKAASAISLYKEKLTAEIGTGISPEFGLVDIDKNGTKELIIFRYLPESKTETCIYVFSEGKLNETKTDASPRSYCPDSKCLEIMYVDTGESIYDNVTDVYFVYYAIQNGRAVKVGENEERRDGTQYIEFYALTEENIAKYCK